MDGRRRRVGLIGSTRSWVLTLACVLGATACGNKGPVYIEDHQRFLRIDAAIEGLRRAYVEHNLNGFRDHLLPNDNVDRVERDVALDLQTFKQISLDLTVERIVIDNENIDVYLHWQGQWKREPTETPIRERGHGRLQFVGTQSILLRAADGNLPFGMSGRSIAQPPSQSSSVLP